ncbi:hypothetical protein GFY24_30425 [Nocardia sp. SYP-A9097]|uniref:hypothetical protein n=1 Tax=Nocardia sp. SYP-A9097 TaxID=2663237 RepID=UPI00129B1CD7|nr:hypothetical protein [Nocardia sp. SYP-A9097]MRH91704.1 hypothetical protein [Nocardia sp. SYP-A9097]
MTERTAPAWRRTIASCCTAVFLLAHQAVITGSTVSAVAVSAATMALIVLSVIGFRRNRELRAGRTGTAVRPIVVTARVVTTVAMIIAVTTAGSLLPL